MCIECSLGLPSAWPLVKWFPQTMLHMYEVLPGQTHSTGTAHTDVAASCGRCVPWRVHDETFDPTHCVHADMYVCQECEHGPLPEAAHSREGTAVPPAISQARTKPAPACKHSAGQQSVQRETVASHLQLTGRPVMCTPPSAGPACAAPSTAAPLRAQPSTPPSQSRQPGCSLPHTEPAADGHVGFRATGRLGAALNIT